MNGAASRPAAVTIREGGPGEGCAIRALHMAAFGGSAEADLVDALKASRAAQLSLVAAEARSICGHALFSRLDARCALLRWPRWQ